MFVGNRRNRSEKIGKNYGLHPSEPRWCPTSIESAKSLDDEGRDRRKNTIGGVGKGGGRKRMNIRRTVRGKGWERMKGEGKGRGSIAEGRGEKVGNERARR